MSESGNGRRCFRRERKECRSRRSRRTGVQISLPLPTTFFLGSRPAEIQGRLLYSDAWSLVSRRSCHADFKWGNRDAWKIVSRRRRKGISSKMQAQRSRFCLNSQFSSPKYISSVRDGVINAGGIRFGSAEIYSCFESAAVSDNSLLSKIDDSLVVSLKTPQGDDEVAVIFLVVQDGDVDWNELVKLVAKTIRDKRSARHVPRFAKKVKEIPKTLNGKKVEVPVKKSESSFCSRR